MSISVHPQIRALKPYKAGRSAAEIQRDFRVGQVIKLGSNENPLGISSRAAESLRQNLGALNRYPDSSYHELLETLAHKWFVPTTNLALGNGSNELIDLILRIFAEPGENVVMAQSGFAAFAVCAQTARLKLVRANESASLELNVEDFVNKCLSGARIGYLANPNNPTGEYIPKIQLIEILKKTEQLKDFILVVDEAYVEFVTAEKNCSILSELHNFRHLVVLRTFSKAYGLAGLRVGVMAGHQDLVELLQRVRNPFNVNSSAVVAAISSLEDNDFLHKTLELTWQGREFWSHHLSKLDFTVYPSQGNFILCDLHQAAEVVEQKLLAQGVILRPVLNYGLLTHMRISVGLEIENTMALNALKKAIL